MFSVFIGRPVSPRSSWTGRGDGAARIGESLRGSDDRSGWGGGGVILVDLMRVEVGSWRGGGWRSGGGGGGVREGAGGWRQEHRRGGGNRGGLEKVGPGGGGWILFEPRQDLRGHRTVPFRTCSPRRIRYSRSAENNGKRGLSMGIIWIVVGVAIAGALFKGIMRARNRSAESHLGFVSHQWIAEHRHSLMSDAQR